MTETYPLSPADSVSEQTLLNITQMRNRLAYLEDEHRKKRSNAQGTYAEERVSSLTQQLQVKALEVVELEAVLERVETWKGGSMGTALAEAAAIELDDILSDASNAALVEHDLTVRRDAYDHAVAVIAATPIELTGSPDWKLGSEYFERALREAAARVETVKELTR